MQEDLRKEISGEGRGHPLVQDQRTSKAFNLAPLISVSDY